MVPRFLPVAAAVFLAAALVAVVAPLLAARADRPAGVAPRAAPAADAGQSPVSASPAPPAALEHAARFSDPSRAASPAPLATPPIRWRKSRAVGVPQAGRLARGVLLPHEGEHFFTWDPILETSPNRAWRRWGTDVLVRRTLRVAREHRAAHPDAPRLAIGDISRPRGGDFGRLWGIVGHVSHQNGLDVDVYYPRRDRRERAPASARAVDRRLAQDLVDRFVAAGAEKIFVGPNVGLTGPPSVVQPLANHDDHLHVRFRPIRR